MFCLCLTRFCAISARRASTLPSFLLFVAVLFRKVTHVFTLAPLAPHCPTAVPQLALFLLFSALRTDVNQFSIITELLGTPPDDVIETICSENVRPPPFPSLPPSFLVSPVIVSARHRNPNGYRFYLCRYLYLGRHHRRIHYPRASPVTGMRIRRHVVNVNGFTNADAPVRAEPAEAGSCAVQRKAAVQRRERYVVSFSISAHHGARTLNNLLPNVQRSTCLKRCLCSTRASGSTRRRHSRTSTSGRTTTLRTSPSRERSSTGASTTRTCPWTPGR